MNFLVFKSLGFIQIQSSWRELGWASDDLHLNLWQYFNVSLYQEVPSLRERPITKNIGGHNLSYILKGSGHYFVILFYGFQKLRFVLHWMY